MADSRLNPNAPPFNPRTVATSPEFPAPAPAPAPPVVAPADLLPMPYLYPPPLNPMTAARPEFPAPAPPVVAPADLLPMPCLYPPPPPPCAWPAFPPGGYPWCVCGRFGSNGCTCAQMFMAGVPVFLPPAAHVQCQTPPLPPQPATQCHIAEISEYGSVLSSKSPQPSPPTVKESRRRLAFDQKADTTSLMISNIPNKFMKERLMGILDEHCAEVNARLTGAGDVVKSEYDFVYVPIDFGTKRNKGYAFVNMTTPAAARRLHAHLHGHAWSLKKVCDVGQARFQGLEALLAHFAESVFPCEEKEFLPARFEPPRDGIRTTATHVVGRLAGDHHQQS